MDSIFLQRVGVSTILSTVHAALVEEFIDGSRLDSLISPNWDEAEALLLGHDLVKALEVVETRKIVHRDITPFNVIRRASAPAGRYVLLDLGIARHEQLSTITATGGHPGTARYRSPEQLRGRDDRQLDTRSDFFNVGLLLFIALTGGHPVGGRGVPDHVYARAVLSGKVTRVERRRLGLARETTDLTWRLLRPYANARYRDTATLLDAIHNAMDADGGRRCGCS